MKITIKEIAKMAGVSPGTVSKVINNYDDVGVQTKEKIIAIMNKAGYQPHTSNKSISNKKTNMIGVIYAGILNADFNHPFFVDVMNFFKKEIGAFGYDLLFFSNERFNKGEEDYLARCIHSKVDGCIIIGGDEIQQSIYDLDNSEIPCIGVDIDLTGPKSGFLMTDNYKIVAKVMEHFYLLGNRDIGYIGGPDSTIGKLRRNGFYKAMSEYGLTLREEWITAGDFMEQSGYDAMKSLLELEQRPEAIFAASDLMAFGAIRAIKEEGMRIPNDVSIIGCDDIDSCRYTDPPLTTVRQDKIKIGKLAAHMLVDMINGQMESSSVMVEPELIVRDTCGAGRIITK